MFRELMPELADEYHLIAPDFPAFGQTESPSREEFTYSFDHLARIVDKFTEAIGLTRFAMYVFDYGAPIGYRLAMWHPERITAIISQNGNMKAVRSRFFVILFVSLFRDAKLSNKVDNALQFGFINKNRC